MTARSIQARATSEAAYVRSLIDSLGDEDWLTQASLEARSAELERIRGLLPPEPAAEGASLTFRGRPVHESEAIRADFAARALKTITSFFVAVSKQLQSRVESAADSLLPSLAVTGTARGSFGFELQETGTAVTGSVLRAASELIEATKSDDAFASALQDSNEDVVHALARFVRMLSVGGATMRLCGPSFRSGLEDDELLSEALRRVGSIKNEAEQRLRGFLAGILPDERRFEFVPEAGGAVIRGSIPAEVFRSVGERLLTGVRSHGEATVLVRSFEQPWSDQPRHTYRLLDFTV